MEKILQEINELSIDEKANKEKLIELTKILLAHYLWEEKDENQLEIPFNEK